MTTTYYLCLSIRGALRNMSKRQKAGMFKHPTGRPMTADEVDDALMDELVKGHEVIPTNKKCGAPCSYASCTGFHYGPDGGCPGHATGELPRDPG
jgi:hypothetical protein